MCSRLRIAFLMNVKGWNLRRKGKGEDYGFVKVLRMLVDVDDGNGGLKDVGIEDLGKERSKYGREQNMDRVKERDKGDKGVSHSTDL